MKEYVVTITETLDKQIVIKANCPEDAEATVRNMYKNESIVLQPEDMTGVEFAVEEKEQ
jgi:hypothetical protein